MVLITGATGLLGRVIALELVKKGQKVRACKRPGSDLADVRESYRYYTEDPELYFDRIEWVDADFNSHGSLCGALEGVKEVYHCAAKISFDPGDREEVLESGILNTRNLLAACRAGRVEKFLYVSTSAVLHANKKDLQAQVENHAANRDIYPPYVVSKYISEKMVWQAYKEGLNTIIISPGMIIGSGNWEKENSQMLDLLVSGRFTFSGGTSCVDVRDVAAVAVSLMERNMFGQRFSVSSENVLYRDLAARVRKMFGLGKPFVCPAGFLKLLKPARKVLGLVHQHARFLTEENIRFVSARQYLSGRKIRNMLRCSFYPVEESIKFHYGNYLASAAAKQAEKAPRQKTE